MLQMPQEEAIQEIRGLNFELNDQTEDDQEEESPSLDELVVDINEGRLNISDDTAKQLDSTNELSILKFEPNLYQD